MSKALMVLVLVIAGCVPMDERGPVIRLRWIRGECYLIPPKGYAIERTLKR